MEAALPPAPRWRTEELEALRPVACIAVSCLSPLSKRRFSRAIGFHPMPSRKALRAAYLIASSPFATVAVFEPPRLDVTVTRSSVVPTGGKTALPLTKVYVHPPATRVGLPMKVFEGNRVAPLL